MKTLLAHGADPDRPDDEGKSLVDLAREYGLDEILEAIEEGGRA